MKSLKCANCGLVNFADAAVCKRCGNQFQNFSTPAADPNYNHYNTPQATSPPTADSYYSNQPASSGDSAKYVKKMIFGALWAVGGTIATIASYGSASGGGKYFVFWGAILFGAIDFLIGLNGFITDKD